MPHAPDAVATRPAVGGALGEHGVPPGGDRVFVGFDDFLDEAAGVPVEARMQLGAGDPAFFEFLEELRRGRVKCHLSYCGEMGGFAKQVLAGGLLGSRLEEHGFADEFVVAHRLEVIGGAGDGDGLHFHGSEDGGK